MAETLNIAQKILWAYHNIEGFSFDDYKGRYDKFVDVDGDVAFAKFSDDSVIVNPENFGAEATVFGDSSDAIAEYVDVDLDGAQTAYNEFVAHCQE